MQQSPMKMIIILTVVVLVVIGSIAVVQISKSRKASTPTAPPFALLRSNELASMLKKKDFFLVNVHIPYEGEIKNTDAFIPYDKIASNLDKLPKDKNVKIVLYCRSGRMSGIAAETLVKLGYTNVAHLAGGMLDWEKNGYEIIKSQ